MTPVNLHDKYSDPAATIKSVTGRENYLYRKFQQFRKQNVKRNQVCIRVYSRHGSASILVQVLHLNSGIHSEPVYKNQGQMPSFDHNSIEQKQRSQSTGIIKSD